MIDKTLTVPFWEEYEWKLWTFHDHFRGKYFRFRCSCDLGICGRSKSIPDENGKSKTVVNDNGGMQSELVEIVGYFFKETKTPESYFLLASTDREVLQIKVIL